MKSRTTLKELSVLLNVSVSTVSKALNNSPDVSVLTRERVKRMASLYNYRPNPAAVNLQRKRSNMIGVVIPNLTDGFFAKVFSGIEKKGQEEGIQVLPYLSDESLELEKKLAKHLSSGMVDGIILAFSEETQRKKEFTHFSSLVLQEIPIVIINCNPPDLLVDKIVIDDEQSFYDATNFFLLQGIHRIGLISSIPYLDSGRRRIKGYKNSMHNREVQTVVNSNIDDLKGGIRKLLLKGSIQGLLCTDYTSTIIVHKLAYELKVRIPESLKVIGFCDDTIAHVLAPSMSYIERFPEKMGYRAMQLLKNRMEMPQKKHFVEKVIKTNLVHLESSII